MISSCSDVLVGSYVRLCFSEEDLIVESDENKPDDGFGAVLLFEDGLDALDSP